MQGAETIHHEHNNVRRGWVLAGLILGLALAALEATVVSTAMPNVIDDLGGEQLYSLPFAIYLLFTTVSSPLWGYVSDRFGSRRLYLVAVGLFLTGSGLCGASSSMLDLILFRAVQGMGGGGLMTITFTIVGELYPLKERSKIQGYISGVWGVAALVGPLAGGFIVDQLSWRWVFYINIPFGLAGATLVLLYYRDWLRPAPGRLDLFGALVFTVSASLLVYGLQTHWFVLALVGLLILISVFPWLELRHPNPLVPLRLLSDSLLSRTVLGSMVAGTAFFGITHYLPLFVQEARGQSATMGGALLSPMVVGWTVSSVIAARLIPWLGLRTIARLGAALMVIGFVLLVSALGARLWILGASGLVAGMGMGSLMLALLLGAQEQSPREQLGSITAMTLFSRTSGGVLGAALMGSLLGATLEQGGAALFAAFWRVPAVSVLLALGVLLIVFRLPDVSRKGEPPPGSHADEEVSLVSIGEEAYESSHYREPRA